MLARSVVLLAAASALVAVSCAASPPAPPTQDTAAPKPAAPASSAPAPVADPDACGALGCRLFDTPAAAFRTVLAQKPLVLGVGEAHARKDMPGVASSAKRFTTELLPELAGKVSDLVIELMVPPTDCEAKTRAVKKELGKVTEKQAETNQNEYVTMGDEAKKLGITPHLIHPTCDDFKALSAPGADPIDAALTLVGRLMRESAEKVLARNAKAGVDKLVVLYGGAIHNAVEPFEGSGGYAFGPSLVATTRGRYVELDVFVPELVSDTDAWKRFAWYPHFDRKAHPDKATLFAPGPASYTMLLSVTPSGG